MNGIQATRTGPPDALRQRIDEFVGLFFYGTMLKEVRQHRMTRSPYGFGGRAEEAFGAQLDMELAQRAGQATHNNLGQAIYRQLKGLRQDALHGNRLAGA